MLQVKEEGSKRKRKMSRSFIFPELKRDHFHDQQSMNCSQISVKSQHKKNQKQMLFEQFLHYTGKNILQNNTEQIMDLQQKQFIQKYESNPFFKAKVDLLIKKQEGKKVKKRSSLVESSDEEESLQIMVKVLPGIRSSKSMRVQETQQQKQKKQLIKRYNELVLKK